MPRRCCSRSTPRFASPARTACASVPLCDFFIAYRQTALRPGELIVSLSRSRSRCRRILALLQGRQAPARRHQHGGRGVRHRSRSHRPRAHAPALAFGGVAATPVLLCGLRRSRCPAARGIAPPCTMRSKPSPPPSTPLSDHRGSAAYRLALAQSLIEKFWWETREAHAA